MVSHSREKSFLQKCTQSMAKVLKYRFSKRGRADLDSIWIFGSQRWSIDQANAYASGLLDKLDLLLMMPILVRKADLIRIGYFRIEYESHSIFYKIDSKGVIIMRILHSCMDTQKQN